METVSPRKVVILIVIIVALSVGVLWLLTRNGTTEQQPTEKYELDVPAETSIGMSVKGRSIEAYRYGDGDTNILFVGGIHGGYEWNSVLLAYAFIDYLEANPEVIPETLSVTVVPNANPDGVYAVIGKEGRFGLADISAGVVTEPGRFNANGVDLNRNFDCKWKPKSTWKGKEVSAGTAAFSEPEARAIRDLVQKENPVAVIFWHSQASAVYASECEDGILPATRDIMNAYARAAKYSAVDVFDSYEITGDAEGWLASIGVPAITVELETREAIEWDRNFAGIKALFDYYRNI